MCRYCVDDLAFLKIEIVHDHLPAMPLPKPPIPLSQPASSESCRRPTPRWMDKLPSNRVSKYSAPRILKPLIPLIIEPSAPPPPCIHRQPLPPQTPQRASTPTPPPSPPSPSTTTTTSILLPPDSYTTATTTILLPPVSYTTASSSPTNATVVVAELRTPIRSSSIRKTYAKAAALKRTEARRRRRRRLKTRSSPYVAKDLSALFSAVGGEEGGRGGLVWRRWSNGFWGREKVMMIVCCCSCFCCCVIK